MTLFATTTNVHKVPSPVSPASHRSKILPPTTAKLCARRSTLGRTQLSAARKTLPTTRSCKYSAPLRHSLLHLARTAQKPHANLTTNAPPSDYIHGGALISATLLPSASQIESFYKKQLFSTIINAQWRKRKIFTTFFRTNDSSSSTGPNATRYYSARDGGVYYTYSYHESGILKGYLDAPDGLDRLNDSSWDISGADISKASAGSAKVGRFNFTEEMGREALKEAMASNGTLSPWEDGAGWRGTWTLPVCDMG